MMHLDKFTVTHRSPFMYDSALEIDISVGVIDPDQAGRVIEAVRESLRVALAAEIIKAREESCNGPL